MLLSPGREIRTVVPKKNNYGLTYGDDAGRRGF